MQFTPVQIVITFISFAITFLLAFFWYIKDRNAEASEHHMESFSVLMSVFFWSVAFTFVLKMGLDLIAYYDIFGDPSPTWFFIASLFLEEIVKISALLVGVGIADKRFNELSDGVIYTVFAVLGFLFFENIAYLIPEAQNWKSFMQVLAGRNIFTFAMHLFTIIFGVFYATAYLRSKSDISVHRVKPWQIGKQLQILWQQFGVMTILWIPFAPVVTIWKFFSKGLNMITIPEVLWSGFLLSSYLHIGYDLLLDIDNAILHSITFFAVLMFLFVLYSYFHRLDARIS